MESVSHALRALSGRYYATHMLGRGAYGVVLRCNEIATGLAVAIKIMASEAELPVPCMSEAAVIELRWTLAMHGVPNVIAFDRVIVLTDFTVCFVMNVYDCTLLSAIFSKKLTAEYARAAFVQIAKGLHAMHARGLCHRDLKPSNILMDLASGAVVIADLGMARDAVDQRSAFVPLTGEVITIGHAPMETLTYTCRYGTSVDIWSLGVILVELHMHTVAFKPCTDRRAHALVIMKALGVPLDHSREFLNTTCSIPLPTIERYPPKPQFMNSLRESGAPEAAVDVMAAMLRYVPDDRITAEDVLRTDYVQACDGAAECLASFSATFVPKSLKEVDEDVHGSSGKARVSLLLEYDTMPSGATADVKDEDERYVEWHLSTAPSSVRIGRHVLDALFHDDTTMHWYCEAWLLGSRFYTVRNRRFAVPRLKTEDALISIAACITLAVACTRPSSMRDTHCRYAWIRRVPVRVRGHMSFEDVAVEEVRVLRDLGLVVPRTPLRAWQMAFTELKTLAAVRAYCASLIT